ncbi:pitrilysin family protein [Roseisolibacter sp. H3M3-2]|uniref:M16 family metallopeptidase n=1 Tax=Roseisolibacter sp. H3M3-2 TaxID=3031323 RepID=UPI0023DCB044|nr:pitrilysin family protein [Roseisolibacter sp. H3M3-2]MDF1504420.1 pitrilysin family protein [Roseisolibacter sp. H3M3-2]
MRPASDVVEAGPRRTTLDNGLTVLSEHIPGVRSVAFGAFVQAGSIHETPASMGVSHLLEHMVFKGTPTRSARQLSLEVESLGGSLDAYTTREYTSYQARVLAEHLDVAADVIGDLVFRPLLREEDLRLERNVILEEIGMVEDTPDDLVFELHNELLWGDHPYGYSILGTRETVNALGTDALRTLHARAYHPGRLVVAAAGKVEHEALVEALLRTGWGAAPAGDATPLPSRAPVTAPPGYRHRRDRSLTQTHVVFGSATPPHADERRYALSLVSMVLGGGMSSRLFQKVREELGLAYAVHTFQAFHVDTGMQGVYVASAPGTARQATQAIRDELRRLVDAGIVGDELAAAKRQLRGQVILSQESVTNHMYRAAGEVLYGEPFRPLDVVLAEIDAIDEGAVLAVAREFFDPDRQSVLSLGPKTVG